MSATETVEAVSRSVTQLGSRFGLSAQEFNVGLWLAGLYDGEPGAWFLTEKGKQFATVLYHENGYGGYAGRSWDTMKWLETVTAEMDFSEENIARIRQFLADRRVLNCWRFACHCLRISWREGRLSVRCVWQDGCMSWTTSALDASR